MPDERWISFTLIWSVLTLGKHSRNEGTVLTSSQRSKCTCKAKIWTCGMMVPVLTLVPACGVNIQMQCNESEIKIMYLS